MSDILKPCPFCGNEAEFFIREHWYSEEYKTLIIECRECFATMELMIDIDTSIEDFEKAKRELFEAWNSRSERMAKVSNQIFNNSNPYTVGAWIGTCECGELVSYSSKYCHMCGARLEWE